MKITPYKINIAEAELDDLKSRLKHTRWPVEVSPGAWEGGVPHTYLKKLVTYWGETYDWRQQEARLNEYPQFIAEVDGQAIHFFHIQSKEKGAMPLLLLHGWPSSGIEFLKIVDLLTNPQAHGGKAEDAFHLVIPTMPGYGLSPAPTKAGWVSRRIAQAYVQVMEKLGYERYGVQGTDMGADVAGKVDAEAPGHVIGLHINNQTATFVAVASFMGVDLATNENLSPAQRKRVQTMIDELPDENGYLEIQKTRPKTLGYALNDSPVGQLAWIVEKFKEWTHDSKELPEDAVDLDQLLANVSLYWFGGGGAASAQSISENLKSSDWSMPSKTPSGQAIFGADDLARPLGNPDGAIKHWTEYKEGGHFPAMEEPKLLADDIRTFFSNLKS